MAAGESVSELSVRRVHSGRVRRGIRSPRSNKSRVDHDVDASTNPEQASFELAARSSHALDGLLPGGWIQLSGVRRPGRTAGRLDHVVIGPGGVFVIEVRGWTGRIDVAGETLWTDGEDRAKAVAAVAEAAGDLRAAMLMYQRHLVAGVLCVQREEPLTGRARDVLVCSTSSMRSMLGNRAPVLSPGEVAQVLALLTEALDPLVVRAIPAMTGVSPASPPSPDPDALPSPDPSPDPSLVPDTPLETAPTAEETGSELELPDVDEEWDADSSADVTVWPELSAEATLDESSDEDGAEPDFSADDTEPAAHHVEPVSRQVSADHGPEPVLALSQWPPEPVLLAVPHWPSEPDAHADLSGHAEPEPVAERSEPIAVLSEPVIAPSSGSESPASRQRSAGRHAGTRTSRRSAAADGTGASVTRAGTRVAPRRRGLRLAVGAFVGVALVVGLGPTTASHVSSWLGGDSARTGQPTEQPHQPGD